MRILLVEDSPSDAEIIITTLRRSGYSLGVHVVHERSEFERALESSQYDLILTGHDLVTWTGMDALQVLRDSGKDIPLIVITGSLGDEAAVQYLKGGATDYVLKDHLGRLPIAIEHAIRETTARVHAAELQERFARGKREWELTFDAVPDPVIVIGNDCHILRANKATANVFGLAVQDIAGKPCYEVIHGRDIPLPTCPHQCLLETGHDSEGDIEEPRLGKTFHSSTSVLSDPDGTVRGCVHVLRDVTERKRIEAELRLSDEILRHVGALVLLVDQDGKVTYVSPFVKTVLGYEPDDVLGDLWWKRSRMDRVEGLREKQHVCGVIRGDVEVPSQEYERRVFHRDGSERWISWRDTILDDRLLGVGHDVTNLKRAEEALKESEKKYRLLFEKNPQPMWVYDVASLRFLAVNQAAIDHYGYSRDEFLALTLKDIRPAEDVAALIRSIRDQKEEVDRAGLWKHRTKDGRIIYVEITDCRIDFEGQAASLVLANDVTEQKRAELELQESEEKYRGLVENASYGIYRSTRDGKLLDVNSAFVEMLSYGSKEELLRLNLETDIYKNPADRQNIIRRAEADDRRIQAEATFKRKDGTFIQVRMDGRAVRDADNNIAYFEVIAEDITQQASLEAQLRQAQKMEAVGRLAGGIAHDFNNVLMIVSSYAELISSCQSPDPAIQRYTEHIRQASDKATSLTRQLLAFSRKQLLQPAVLDLRTIVSGISSMLKPMLGEDIQLTVTEDPQLGSIYSDRAQIEQVLMNLAVNARDAMPNGGNLQIDLQNVTIDDNYIFGHSQMVPGSYVVLAVSDNGIGIDSETQTKIFEPFFTTKSVGKGTGLGLSTVYGIVKQSGGFIWVYSEPGLGTTFKIYLPRVPGNAEPTSHSSDTTADFVGGNETVLLVDDESGVRTAAREFLEKKGYHVLEAENGAGALGTCTAYQGSIDVLVTDLIMPGMRGPELARKIAILHPQVATVYMSGYTDRSRDIEDLGPDAVFLQKPFSLSLLAQGIQSALQREMPRRREEVKADVEDSQGSAIS